MQLGDASERVKQIKLTHSITTEALNRKINDLEGSMRKSTASQSHDIAKLELAIQDLESENESLKEKNKYQMKDSEKDRNRLNEELGT